MKRFLLTSIALLLLSWLTGHAIEFDVGNLHYKTYTGETMECTGLSAAGQNVATVTVPGKVTYGGKTYRVRAVGVEAFKDNKKLTNVRLGWGIEFIFSRCFSGCSNLRVVYVPSSVNQINNDAFKNCTSLTGFYYAGETPPNVSDNVSPFSGVSNLNIIVSTQAGRVNFSNNTVWNSFGGIVSYNGGLAHDFSYEGMTFVITSGLESVNGYCTLVGALSGTTAINLSSSVIDRTNQDYGAGSGYFCIINKVADYAFSGNSTITRIGSSSDYMSSVDLIGYAAFSNCSALTSIYIDADTLSNNAFADCTKLTTAQLSLGSGDAGGVKRIGLYAFSGSGLTSVTIPASTKYIGTGAFRDCPSLKRIDVSSGSTTFKGSTSGTLFNANYSTIIQVPGGATTFGYTDATTTINDQAFYGCRGLSFVDIPYGITTIGNSAFSNSTITTLKIPSSVSMCHTNALQGLKKLQNLYFNLSTIPTYQGSTILVTDMNSSAVLHVPQFKKSNYTGNSHWNSAFASIDEGGYDIEYNNMYYTVTSTNSYTDSYVQSTPVNGTVRMVKGRYINTTNVAGILTIPNKVDHRGKSYIVDELATGLFKNFKNLNRVTGGDGVKYINPQCFYGCTNLEYCNIMNPYWMGDSVFYGATKLISLNLGDRLSQVGKSCFRETALTSLIFPPSLLRIGQQFVMNATQLDTLELSPNLLAIPERAFQNCYAKYIVIPYGVPSIGAEAFRNDAGGATHVVVIPSSVTTMSSRAFYGAKNIEAIYLNVPHSVFKTVKTDWERSSSMGASGIYDWSGVNLYVSAGQLYNFKNDPGIKACFNASKINLGAFDFCFSKKFMENWYLGTVVDKNSKTAKYVYSGSKNTFTGKFYATSTETDYHTGIEYTMVAFDDSCLINRTGLKEVNIPSTIKRIGKYAFCNTGLTGEVVLPSSVNFIGWKAFYDCPDLESLFINNPDVGDVEYAFFGNNDTSFRCYVPLSQLYRLWNICTWSSNSMINAYYYLRPYLKPKTQWSAISCFRSLIFPSGLECYVVKQYDASKKQVTTERVTNNIYKDMGILVKGNVGQIYRFDIDPEVSNSPTDLLQGPPGGAPFMANSTSSTDMYVFNTSTRKFDRLNGTQTIYSGDAFMPLPVSVSNSVANITVDILNTALKGDVNRDGAVNVTDVTTLVNMILGVIAKDQESADVDSNGSINVSDVTALVNLILGIS